MTVFNEEYDHKLDEAYDAFVAGESYDYSFMRPEIYASWMRSKSYNVPPYGDGKFHKLSVDRTKQLLEDNKQLIEISRKHLSKIYDVIKPSGYYIFLSDSRGYLLDIIMDDVMKAYFPKDPSLVPGASRSERYVGTNSIGTCLSTGEAMDFYGGEHYIHKAFTCSGAPIKNPEGKIIGAISITGLKETYQPHTLAIVVSVRDAIEAELKELYKKPALSTNTIYSFDNLIGECDKMREAKELAKQISKLDAPILLWGESGTGKEVFAQAIHNESNRCGGPFIGINCGAIPRELIESELFGYEGGSFTGARQEGSKGKLEAANGGTLFLDEVESMPLDVQIKLLRVLSTMRLTRVGSSKEIPIDIRIISATKSDLYIESEQGRFREDLYYRINTITLKIPPLRDRGGDIRLLADYYIERMKQAVGITDLTIPDGFYDLLDNYQWKGNVRELRNIIEGTVSLSRNGGTLNTSMLPERMTRVINQETSTATDHAKAEKQSLKDAEIEVIRNAIEFSGGNLTAAAKALGIARSTLYKKINANEELKNLIGKS